MKPMRVLVTGLALSIACTCGAPTAAQPGQGGAKPPSDPQHNAADARLSAPIQVIAPRPLQPEGEYSAWKRVVTTHAIVWSDGGAEQLQDVAVQLERLHALLVRLYPLTGGAHEPPRLQVVLFDHAAQMRERGLDNPHTDEPAYRAPFARQRYYDPRPGGAVLALARSDQILPLQTSKAAAADCEDFLASHMGADCVGAKMPYHPPAIRPWQAVLFGAYAQHIVLNREPAIYPRWYYDGIAALFSTVEFRNDGVIAYGLAPAGYRQVFRSYGYLDTMAVLDGDYLRKPSPGVVWTPYHAWLLAHFLAFSRMEVTQRRQFRQYLNAIAQGASMADAARIFGSAKRLKYALLAYSERSLDHAVSVPVPLPPRPAVAPLSRRAADAMLAALFLGADPEAR